MVDMKAKPFYLTDEIIHAIFLRRIQIPRRIPAHQHMVRGIDGVAQALEKAHRDADVAIVSSANLGAVLDEWDLYGLLEYTDVVLAQDAGSKAF